MNNKIKSLVYMAFYAALFMVLYNVENMIPFLRMGNGGSIGISTIALLLCSYHLGWARGVVVGIVSVLIQFLSGPMYVPNMLGFALDYFIAFGIYGIADWFPNIGFFYSGVVVTNLIRFISHTVGGVIVWNTPLWGSIVYNGPYMLMTAIVGAIVVPVIKQRMHIK